MDDNLLLSTTKDRHLEYGCMRLLEALLLCQREQNTWADEASSPNVNS